MAVALCSGSTFEETKWPDGLKMRKVGFNGCAVFRELNSHSSKRNVLSFAIDIENYPI
jgi:hypothetical protein